MQNTEHAIEAIRAEWGARLLVLGHHYQDPYVLRHADVLGDSLELSRKAGQSGAERIVFCGVHFMAESADILTGPAQAVYMPDTSAGCPMADMADIAQVERAWTLLQRASPTTWLPVAYVNSSAAVKAFCGAHGGCTCTSSNAARVLSWVFGQGRGVFFLPDRHLAANSAHDLEVPDEQIAFYDPHRADGGLAESRVRSARVIAWEGCCPIHMVFTVEQVRALRVREPESRVIVHPECTREVVRLADAHGSTSQIIRYVESAPDGTRIYVGTETHLVRRLAAEQGGRVDVRPLAHAICPNMARTNPRNLLALLQNWPERNRVRVGAPVAANARLALERMLSL